MRFNHEQPPFDNPKMRQAVEWVIDQKEMMTALAGDQKYWKTCYSYFSCGTPLANDAANAPLSGKRDKVDGVFWGCRSLMAGAVHRGPEDLRARDGKCVDRLGLLATRSPIGLSCVVLPPADHTRMRSRAAGT